MPGPSAKTVQIRRYIIAGASLSAIVSRACSIRPLLSVSCATPTSFDYLTVLQRHAQEVETKPAEWMPWNYRETLERTVPLSDSA